MVMEFGKYSKMSVGEVAKGVATEGGAVVAGLLGAATLGKQVEKFVKTGVVPSSTITDKLLAWGGNNAPKLALWYIVRKEGDKFLGGYEKDIAKGVLGSVVLDTLLRTGNSGAPGTTVKLFGIDVLGSGGSDNVSPQMQENMQKVLQENSSLRNQLNGALQRIASASPNVTVTPIQPQIVQTAPIQPLQTAPFYPDHDRRFGMMGTPEAEERRKNYGSMTPPIEAERNRKFSQMNKVNLRFAGESDSTASAFGML